MPVRAWRFESSPAHKINKRLNACLLGLVRRFLMPDEFKCFECEAPAIWVRCTQFAGDHYFCDTCAKKEEDFGKEDDSYFVWEKIPEK